MHVCFPIELSLQMILFSGTLVLSYMTSLVLHVCVEAPCANLLALCVVGVSSSVRARPVRAPCLTFDPLVKNTQGKSRVLKMSQFFMNDAQCQLL